MKSLFLLIFIISCSVSFSQVNTAGSGWSWYNPGPMGNDVSSFSIAPDGTQYLCGTHGTLMKSTDGGLHFTPMGSVGESELKEIKVLEGSLKIIVVGQDGARLSNDGGAHWVSYAPNYTLLNTVAVKNDKIILAGDNGKIIASTDNGATFNLTYNNPVTDFKRVIFLTQNGPEAIAIGTNGKIFYSNFWGMSWINVTNPGGGTNFNGIAFANASTGMIVGENAKILRTTDGRQNWTQLVVSIGVDLYDVRMQSPTNAIACGDGGKIFRTTDGGENWSEIFSSPTGNRLVSFDFFNSNPNIGAVWGQKGISATTTDGGATWNEPFQERKEFNLIAPLNYQNRDNSSEGDTLIAVGNSGAFCKSTNAGTTWISYNTGTTLNLETAYFVDSQTGWAVGGKESPLQRIILKTTNGGLNWSTQLTANSNNLYDIKFINATTGLAVGNFGVILRTTNAGTNWISITGVTWTLQDVKFLDANNVIAVGEAGRIFKSTNAGLNWTQVNSGGITSMQYSVDFTDANTGISVGSAGTMYRTTNSGVNWTLLPSVTQNTLNGIYFVNSLTGYVCGTNLGNDCSVLKTTNGGLNWARQNTGTSNILNSVYFSDANTGFVVGEAGTILKTTNGGASVVGIHNLSAELPKTHYLSQNYPNPFNPVTKIKFELPKNSFVKIIVYDISGKEIETLVNENLKAGYYETDFNGSNRSSGIYFYKLITNDFIETKKMILVK
ncbi:MAG: T9SS type A sorting domain-containing protein [Bacteroidetes bacterium]|nr:T9SS type A sorting domain-containing protein [Bacteroidota bacterium]